MSQAPVHVYQPGEVLTAANLNLSVQQPLTDPIAVISPTTGPINFNLQAHTGLPLSAVSGSSGTVGYVATLSAGLVPVWNVSQSAQPARMGVNGLVGSATSSQVASFAFDQATLLTTNKTIAFNVTATSSFDINAGTTGPGGRDQTAVFASTFVHAFVITTGLASTAPVGILSTNLVPTMPTSYTAYAYLATLLYSSASTQFAQPQIVRGVDVFLSSALTMLSGAQTTSEKIVSLVSAVPAQAINVRARHMFSNLGAASGSAILRIESSHDWYTVESSSNATIDQTAIEFPNVSQSVISLVSNAAAQEVKIDVLGYTVANGG